MKRKNAPAPDTDDILDDESVVDPALLAKAKQALNENRPKGVHPCVICGSEAAPNSTEKLCWVCRRLKISAWRESDPQLSAQE
jgi:hypothetical protein